MPPKPLTRRELLRSQPQPEPQALPVPCSTVAAETDSTPHLPGTSTCAKITDIDHVVIFIQENRSFDHYFGSYQGRSRILRSQARPTISPIPATPPALPTACSCPSTSTPRRPTPPAPTTSPTTGSRSTRAGTTAQWMASSPRAWPSTPNDAVLSMGYYTRADLPYYYAVADAFTLCDNYCCSVIGPTDPNRLYTMAASIDPDGKNGGPLLQTLVTNRATMFGKLTYTTMPEQLQARGISWKIYSSPDDSAFGSLETDNVLPYFKNFQDPITRFSTRTHSARSSQPISLPTRSRATCRRSPGSSALSSPPTIRHRHRSSVRTRCPPSSVPSPPTPSHGRRPFSSSPTMKMAASSITSRPSPRLQARRRIHHRAASP